MYNILPLEANLWTHLLLLYFSLISLRNLKKLSLLKGDENFFKKSSEGVLKSIVEQKSMR